MASKKRFQVTLADIQAAKEVLSKRLVPTPLVYNGWLSELFGCHIFLKLETAQPIGSFKIRGATYKISQLTAAQKRKGVIAASAGNHAQGVAWGSRELGTSAIIVMPKNAPLVKVQNTKALGAQIILEGDTYDEAFAHAKKLSKKTGRVLIHAFEDEQVVAGQGTTGLEILDQLPLVDVVVCSIGGGGLLAGIATVMRELRPTVKLYGCQASGSPSMLKSFKKGHAIALDSVDTFADGIAVARTSEPMLKILKEKLDGVLQADDEAIAAAILMLLEKAKVVAEGAAGVPLAVLDQLRSKIKGKRVVLIIGGGNIDVNLLGRVIDRGMIKSGRRLRLNVLMSDRPGSLAKLTALLAKEGANVLQAIHDRNEPSVRMDQTTVELTLETRGSDHSAKIIKALEGQVSKIEIMA